MLAIRVLESVYASYHFIVGNVDRHGFDTSFVVDRCFGENLAEIWSLLSQEEKRAVAENLVIHTFKKNQLIYGRPRMCFCVRLTMRVSEPPRLCDSSLMKNHARFMLF